MPMFQTPNASVDLLPMQQRFMTEVGYVNPMMTPNYQPSVGPVLMNANNGWMGQFVFPQMTQQNHQAVGFQQGQMQVGFQNQGPANQRMNIAQQIGG